MEEQMAWTNAPLLVHHGTVEAHATNIQNYGIDLNRCRPNHDFLRGFYL